MDSIVVRCTRPLCISGRRIEDGQTIKASPLDADALLSSGRAELVHAPDGDAVTQARRDSIKRAIKVEGRPWQAPEIASPWTRVEQ